MRGCSSLVLLCCLVGLQAQAAVLIEEGGKQRPKTVQSEAHITPDSFASASELRQKRRMGVGASFFGRAGFVDLDVEMNVHPNHSVITSIGGGPGYSGMAVGYRWIPLSGRWNPTIGISMAGWRGNRQQITAEGSIPDFFAQKDEANGQSLQNVYLIPSIGIESIQLSGPGAGGAFFAEALIFSRIPSFEIRPLGSVGARFYF